jgi:hypothetical protein
MTGMPDRKFPVFIALAVALLTSGATVVVGKLRV